MTAIRVKVLVMEAIRKTVSSAWAPPSGCAIQSVAAGEQVHADLRHQCRVSLNQLYPEVGVGTERATVAHRHLLTLRSDPRGRVDVQVDEILEQVVAVAVTNGRDRW
jgi:hypothetical protein